MPKPGTSRFPRIFSLLAGALRPLSAAAGARTIAVGGPVRAGANDRFAPLTAPLFGRLGADGAHKPGATLDRRVNMACGNGQWGGKRGPGNGERGSVGKSAKGTLP